MVNRRYCLLPNALAHRNKDEKGSYRFSKVCSGQARNDRERWLVRFVGSCATGPVGSPLRGKYWCARANRPTLATGPRASLHVNPFAQIARTNRPTVAFCNFIHTMPSPNPICAPSRNIFPKILPRLSILSVSAPTDTWRRFEFLIFLSWQTDEYLLNLNRYFLIL